MQQLDREGALEPAEVNAFRPALGAALSPQRMIQMRLSGQQRPPSVIALTRLPPGLAHPRFKSRPLSLDPILAAKGDDYVIERLGVVMRVHLDRGRVHPTAVLLPLDWAL